MPSRGASKWQNIHAAKLLDALSPSRTDGNHRRYPICSLEDSIHSVRMDQEQPVRAIDIRRARRVYRELWAVDLRLVAFNPNRSPMQG